ncbi:pilus assembly protein PilZ [Terrilactibacillus sp. BCM23-1]|uniref:Pilus assembly protein PilZ n=1 Tax=Terrilactibacillus tamarindi TaxID=2599694 RepID=A0A6N8CQ15_9BACI|nr:flagellar brake domain-containing protein [Terrilactibacillus tamarindi]MTT31257.1 pilus assembly protein PilZ [Terrilactibacillus tamarindi]
MFKIGENLILEYREKANEIKKFRCRITQIELDKGLYIDYPVNIKTRKTELIPIRTQILAYYNNNQKVVRFPTFIIERKKSKVPLLMLQYPSREDIKVIQRRNYVRVQVSVDVAIHFKQQDKEPFTTLSSDIGGGGILINLPANQELIEEEMVNVWVSLPMQSGQFQYIQLTGRVVRLFNDKKTGTDKASIEFKETTEKQREPIIRFCFEQQLQERRIRDRK